MTILSCWGWSIPDHWLSLLLWGRPPACSGLSGRAIPRLATILLATAFSFPAAGQTLESAARKYRDQPTTANRTAVVRAAESKGLRQLALASADLDAKRYAPALEGFRSAITAFPTLADHANYGAARAMIGLGRPAEAIPFFVAAASADAPVSPHRTQSVLDAAELLLQQDHSAQAASLLSRNLDGLPEGKGHYFFASALEAQGNRRAAALEYQRGFFQDPMSSYAEKAKLAMERLRTALGPDYPPELPDAWLSRADKLIQYARGREAAAELTALLPRLVDADKQTAEVRIGAALYRARDYVGVMAQMTKLNVTVPEANAERLYYIVMAGRRLNRAGEVTEALRELAAKHPNSPWRLQALLDGVNRFLIANQPAEYEPIYEACYTTFQTHPEAGECHWKVAWSHYVRRKPDARGMLERHVKLFPKQDDAAAALYFLGRMAEVDRKFDKAHAYYEAVSDHFPNYYYAVVARERLEAPALSGHRTDTVLAAELTKVGLPVAGSGANFSEDAVTKERVRRGRLLASAAMDEWALQELLYGSSHGANRNVVGIELAKIATHQGNHAQGLRYIKGHAAGYLNWRLDDAPVEFWEHAFPMLFRDHLEKYSGAQNIDPHIVAGLMRQESEFDPKVVSRAKAIGLTQIMPATGRELSRRLGYKTFRTSMLTQPEFNIRLGTYYLRRVLDSFDGMWVAALAGYNAGPSRANTWLRWAEYREPAEFIETIPFRETRNYVQSVLRNADIYRRLYAKASARVPSSVGARNSSVQASTGSAGRLTGQRRAAGR